MLRRKLPIPVGLGRISVEEGSAMACEMNPRELLTENEMVRLVNESAIAVNVHTWRLARLASIARFETPDEILDGPKVVLHIVPLSLFGLQPDFIDLGHIKQERTREGGCRVAPLFCTGFNSEYNLDGFLTYASSAYLQVFRFGGIESARQLRTDSQGTYRLYVNIEAELLGYAKRYMAFLRDCGMSAPLVVMLSVSGVAGATAIYGSSRAFPPQRSIKQEMLLSPRVLITDRSGSLAEVMRPVLDMLCGAAGLSKSPLYDESGRWAGPEF